jgi:hypothetical protein
LFDLIRRYLSAMDSSEIQNLAIQHAWRSSSARRRLTVSSPDIRFDEADGGLLYAYAKDEQSASEIEDEYSLHISINRKSLGRFSHSLDP